jgi:hypothetical protein
MLRCKLGDISLYECWEPFISDEYKAIIRLCPKRSNEAKHKPNSSSLTRTIRPEIA